ncbi:MAG: indolepyruvate oxidoreductase subunit beta [Bilophila wadsworthia]
MSNRIRIYMTGVGGQGTLTATTLLARVAVAQGVEVVAGEIHGMAQRGGVVESTILLGGWKSPKLGFGEADIVLGFEPLETLRGLRYLKQGGVVFSSTDVIPPLSVSAGREVARGWTPWNRPCVIALPPRGSSCRSMGIELGSAQCGNNILLGALCASGLLPFGFEALEEGIRTFMPAKLVDVNLKAAERGREILASSRLF